MSTVIIGNSGQLATIYLPGHALNQWGQGFQVPSNGWITRVGGWINGTSGYGGQIENWTFAVWDHATGPVLAQSALQIETFPYSWPTVKVYQREADLLTPLAVTAGQWIRLGWENVDDGLDFVFGQQAGSGPMYHRAVSWSNVPVTFVGGSDNAGILNAYAYLVSNVAPDKPLTESYGVV